MSIKLDWIRELIDILPKTEIRRKNIIEIAGYPKWENVNSNLLAFYLDENEEHKLGRLFINSLFDILSEKADRTHFDPNNFETDFTVRREFPTQKGGRIDVLIMEKENQEEDEAEDETDINIMGWAIILENKLASPLSNDLSDYWKSVEVDDEKKIGVILSLNKTNVKTKKETPYINITHKELVDKVKENLHEFYDDADDRHLLFLKEYFSNIYSFYQNDANTKNMDKTLKLFHSRQAEIQTFKDVDRKLLVHVSRTLFQVMTAKGFPQTSNKETSKGKHFQISTEPDHLSDFFKNHLEYAIKFRFWVNISRLRYSNSFRCFFELWGNSNTKHGNDLKRELEDINIFTENVQKGTYGKAGSGYQHIYDISITIDTSTDEDFGLVLERELNEKLFNHKNRFIETAVSKLKDIMENE